MSRSSLRKSTRPMVTAVGSVPVGNAGGGSNSVNSVVRIFSADTDVVGGWNSVAISSCDRRLPRCDERVGTPFRTCRTWKVARRDCVKAPKAPAISRSRYSADACPSRLGDEMDASLEQMPADLVIRSLQVLLPVVGRLPDVSRGVRIGCGDCRARMPSSHTGTVRTPRVPCSA